MSRDEEPAVYRINYPSGGGEDAGTLSGAMTRIRRRHPRAVSRTIRNLDGSVSWWVYRTARDVGHDIHVALIEKVLP